MMYVEENTGINSKLCEKIIHLVQSTSSHDFY